MSIAIPRLTISAYAAVVAAAVLALAATAVAAPLAAANFWPTVGLAGYSAVVLWGASSRSARALFGRAFVFAAAPALAVLAAAAVAAPIADAASHFVSSLGGAVSGAHTALAGLDLNGDNLRLGLYGVGGLCVAGGVMKLLYGAEHLDFAACITFIAVAGCIAGLVFTAIVATGIHNPDAPLGELYVHIRGWLDSGKGISQGTPSMQDFHGSVAVASGR